MHATPNTGTGASIWGRGYGQWGKGRDRGFNYGTDQDIYGGALGVDFRSGGAVFGVAGGWSQIDVDAGLSFGISPGSSVFAGYEGTFRKDTRNHGVSAGFRIALGGQAVPPPPPPVIETPPPPPPPPATQTCADGSVILATEACPAPPPPPPPPPPAAGERG